MFDEDGDVIAQGSRRLLPLPSRWTRITTAIAVALAVGAAVAVAWPSAGSHQRANRLDPCRLLPAAAIAKYVPGASNGGPVTFSSTTQRHGECFWSATSRSLLLSIDNNATVSAARREFGMLFNGPDQAPPLGSTARTVSGLADQARALVTRFDPAQPEVYLLVRSGATVLAVNYELAAGATTTGATALAEAVAIARIALSG